MAGACRPLSICARTVGGAALFVGVVLMWRVQLINQSMFAAPLPVRADERCARARAFFFILVCFIPARLLRETFIFFSVSPPSAPAIRDTYSLFD